MNPRRLCLISLGVWLAPAVGCSLSLDQEECTKDAHCLEGEVCMAGVCEPLSGTEGGPCSEDDVQPCECEDGLPGTQVCVDGTFSACECDSTDGSCLGDEDCEGVECQVGRCVDGTCEYSPATAGTACGDASQSECDLPDVCDGVGACTPNQAGNGGICETCDAGPGLCACVDGTCSDCSGFAPFNGFAGDVSLVGWELTGDWRLYSEAPQTFDALRVAFESRVLGTDGNRAQPYPGFQQESSYARSPKALLPSRLEFLSWHVDEGGRFDGHDIKRVRVSIDGGATWQTIIDCSVSTSDDPAFCDARTGQRSGADWDEITIELPASLQGQVGQVEFAYESGDDCCAEERGWYIDVTNFATQCACQADADCASLSSECGTGTCNIAGECVITPGVPGTACGDASSSACDAPDACNAFGYCEPNPAANYLSSCDSCGAGSGQCWTCLEQSCVDCSNISATNDFSAGSIRALRGWALTGDWGLYDEAPPDDEGAPAIPFNTENNSAPVFGTDGNLVAPYTPGQNSEAENSSATSPPVVLPATLQFDSWNLDEGGAVSEGFGGSDNKIIEVSVDDGNNWETVVDCAALASEQPFCLYNTDRTGDQWDPITVDLSQWGGMVGRIRFSYDTIDENSHFERGWYIDNINLPWCEDSPVIPGQQAG